MYKLLKLSISDLKQFKKIRLESLLVEKIAFGDDYDQLLKKRDSYWLKELSNKFKVWYGIFDGQSLIGIGSIKYVKQKKFSHIAHLSGIYVKNEFRGRGVGRILFEGRIKEAFKNKKIKKLKLIVNLNQEKAISLYKSCGFRIVGEMEKEFFVDGEYYNAYLMELVKLSV